METRKLSDLSGIGGAMLADFQLLGITSVGQLAEHDAVALYERLCELTHARQDICVLDTFVCAIEQARNPDLSMAKRNWWYWSRLRKARAESEKDGR